MLVITSPVGATSGAKWGQRTTMFTGAAPVGTGSIRASAVS